MPGRVALAHRILFPTHTLLIVLFISSLALPHTFALLLPGGRTLTGFGFGCVCVWLRFCLRKVGLTGGHTHTALPSRNLGNLWTQGRAKPGLSFLSSCHRVVGGSHSAPAEGGALSCALGGQEEGHLLNRPVNELYAWDISSEASTHSL